MMHNVNDLIISLSYFGITAQLLVALYKYERLQNMPLRVVILLVLFSLFICFCGLGHALRCADISGHENVFFIVNTLTTVISALTALCLLPLVPHLLDTLDKALNKEVEKSKDQLFTFMGFLCHEVRNPLFVITSCTQFLRDNDKLSAGDRNMIESIDSSAKLMLRLVNDVLDISKIDAGRLELEMHDFNLWQLLDSLESNTRIQLAERHHDKVNRVALQFHVDPDIPKYINSDSIRMLQIFYNLLSNSAKFTCEGEIRFEARVCSDKNEALEAGVSKSKALRLRQKNNTGKEEEDKAEGNHQNTNPKELEDRTTFSMSLLQNMEEGTCVSTPSSSSSSVAGSSSSVEQPQTTEVKVLKFVVSDTGVGIAADRLPTIFEPYTQAKLSDYRTHGGTGLGLSIISNIVKMMGGTISVESTVGVGTSFQILLPVALAEGGDENADNDGFISDQDSSSSSSSDEQQQQEQVDIFSTPILGGSEHGLVSPQKLEDMLPPPNTAPKDILHVAEDNKNLSPRKSPSSSLETNHKVEFRPGLRVMVTDDNGVNRKIMARMLAYFDIEYDLARNGQEAVDLFLQSRNMTGSSSAPLYGLIFMDIHMPVLDGYEAIRQIRQHDAKVPIVSLTANALSEERDRAVGLGATEFETKPILREKLKEICSRLLVTPNEDLVAGGLPV